jgi:hypothetical protein
LKADVVEEMARRSCMTEVAETGASGDEDVGGMKERRREE